MKQSMKKKILVDDDSDMVRNFHSYINVWISGGYCRKWCSCTGEIT